jgi:hypothetical protein
LSNNDEDFQASEGSIGKPPEKEEKRGAKKKNASPRGVEPLLPG